MSEINRRQAFVIEGAEVLPNDRGTAPGQWIEAPGGVVAMLPGPPHELKAMFELQCLPRLRRIVPPQMIRTLLLRVTGIPESDLDQLISPVYKKYVNPVTTILAGSNDIQIHLRARCATLGEAETLLAEVGAPIEALLGDKIYSRNGDPLEVVVGEMLQQAGATVAVAESLTGGMIGERFTSVPGSSRYFLGGFIAYSNAMKTELLGVDPRTLAQFGAVSRETAEAMASGARRRANASYALSVTGVAGPEAAGDQAPVGTVYVGLADAEKAVSFHRQFLGDRQRIRAFTTQMALDCLRRRLIAQ
jgi:nicotinamide-nucleotide amidase